MPEAPPEMPGPDAGQPLARAARIRRKRRDMALALPFLGVFLLVSPLLDVLDAAGRIAGIPVSVIYVFSVWFGLIACTAALSRRLHDDNGNE